MKIEKIYIGGWFQRTMLQLTEIYDFLRSSSSNLGLEQDKLDELNKALKIENIEYGVSGLEYILVSTSYKINVKIFEDGLIVLNNENVDDQTLFADINNLTDYYETKLSPALSYIFSLGAPVPKELANIQTVFPYFIVLNNAKREDFVTLMQKTEKQKYYEFNTEDYDVLRGDKYYFINNKTGDSSQIERYIEEQIFIREFKGQLHRYLNLHRIIWEKIADVKENATVKGSKIIEFTDKIEGYSKTINLIEGRINQMNTYISTREKITKNDKGLTNFLEVSGYRYETLKDTLIYIQHIWSMTKNYVNSAKSLFNGLQADITQKSIGNLTIVTSMGVGASLLGLFTKSAPEFSSSGFIYFFILAVIGYTVNKVMSIVSRNKKYHISDIEYDRDIK